VIFGGDCGGKAIRSFSRSSFSSGSGADRATRLAVGSRNRGYLAFGVDVLRLPAQTPPRLVTALPLIERVPSRPFAKLRSDLVLTRLSSPRGTPSARAVYFKASLLGSVMLKHKQAACYGQHRCCRDHHSAAGASELLFKTIARVP
jgi:hypothetical protein